MTEGAPRAPAVATSSGVPDPLIGRVINERFRVTSVLARGGMGKVYLAEQAPLGRACALKVLNPDYARGQDPEFHKRFFLEASIASKLAHPNTVTIFDFGKTDDGIYYMAMEYLDGLTLHRAIREAGHFSEERTTHVARQICRGLREAHSLGVVHRDLKPANIFLIEHADETDFVKILDFGLVKNMGENEGRFEDLTQAGLFMGSPKYMAPEQIRGDRVDARTDVYALGVVMCEMITGKVPFDRPTSVKILMAHANDPPPALRTLNPNVAISSAFEEMVARSLAKSPNDRYRSMDEVLAALKRLALDAQGQGTPADRSSHPRLVSESGPIPSSLRASAAPESSPSASYHGSIGPVDAGPVHPSRAPNIPGVPGVPDFGSSAPVAPAGPAKLRSRGVVVICAFGALGVAGVLAYATLRTGSDTAKPSAAPAASSAPVASAHADVAPVAAVVVKVRVNSDPAGATVKEDGVELCGSTPCDIVYKGSDADPSREHALVVARPGFRPERTVVNGSDATIVVRLTKDAPRYFPQAVPQPQPAPRPEAPPAPTGYKTDLPY
jgi:eukaryotic-like serine/threonine-protein kinase